MNTFYEVTDHGQFDVESNPIVGFIDEHPVYYDKIKDTVTSKDNTVPYSKFKNAMDSQRDQHVLEEGLLMSKSKYIIHVGCFSLPTQDVTTLLNTIELCRKN